MCPEKLTARSRDTHYAPNPPSKYLIYKLEYELHKKSWDINGRKR